MVRVSSGRFSPALGGRVDGYNIITDYADLAVRIGRRTGEYEFYARRTYDVTVVTQRYIMVYHRAERFGTERD